MILRKCDGLQLNAGSRLREDHSRVVIDLVQLRNAGKRLDAFVRNASDVRRSRDGFEVAEIVGHHLHHTAVAVVQKDVRLACLRVRDHVERLISRPEFRDCRAFDFGARLKLSYRNLHQRSAGVGRDNVLLVADLERNERANGSLCLESAVSSVPDFDTRALGGRERE